MTTYYVATLARYVLVEAESEDAGSRDVDTRLCTTCTPTASDSDGRADRDSHRSRGHDRRD